MNQPLLYRRIVALNRDQHRDLRLAAAPSYAFAATSHVIPAVIDEFPVACADLPIVFAPDVVDNVTPVFLTGLAPGRNAFVGADGAWRGTYIPAYLRRYPFILGEAPDTDPLICLDDTAACLTRGSDAGAALFQADGTDSERLAESIRLVTDFAAAAERTQAMCRLLVDLKLLHGITVQTTTSGESSAMHGLLAVDEAALNALPDAAFLKLRADGILGAIYTHLVSLRAIDRIPTV